MDDDFETLLDLDEDEDPTSTTMSESDGLPSDSTSSEETPKTQTESNKDIIKLQQIIKDQREMIRQQGETIKELKEWRDRLVGKTDEDEAKKKELEIRQKFEEDPLKTVDELVEQKIREIREKVETESITNRIDRIMREIDKEYDIDWDKNYPKIVSYLEDFDEKAKREKPKEVLLAACKLAGILKKKETTSTGVPPYIEGTTGTPGAKGKTEEELIKERIIGKKKKSNNVFGV